MKLKLIGMIIAMLTLSWSALAVEDCSHLKYSNNNSYKAVFEGPYQSCRIANALEMIAEKIG